MQEKATIRAELDTDTGEASFVMSGNTDNLCILIGQIVRYIAESSARVSDIPKDLEMEKMLAKITTASSCEPDEIVDVDLSRWYKEG